MEQKTREVLAATLQETYGDAVNGIEVELEVPRDRGHGDWATNVALNLARILKRAPRSIADELAEKLRRHADLFDAVDVAGPGFINFRIGRSRIQAGIGDILASKSAWGHSDHGAGIPVMVEFVSANPTGPLNVVNARAAAFGGALTRLLAAAGYGAVSEFYINDVGNQIDLLGATFLARYRQVRGDKDAEIPKDGYQGEYLTDLAREQDPEEIDAALAELEPAGQIAFMSARAVEAIRSWQERDLAAYGTRFDRWFHQHQLYPDGLDSVLERLRELGYVEAREGALWFRSTEFGDDQDRVVVRANGDPTYFLADLAYHATKHERGMAKSIDIWGPDHHGYILRMQAGMRALGYGEDWLEVLIVQQVNLLSHGEPVKMSKRRGEFITLQDLLDEVGKETATFFFLQRRAESHLDFDMDLAKKENEENPVFYVKYAHARISGVLRKAVEAGVVPTDSPELSLLVEESELALARVLLRFPGIVVSAADQREPHRVTNYLREVAQAFHLFYHHCRVVGDDAGITDARLALCRAAQIVLANGLALMDITAPERM